MESSPMVRKPYLRLPVKKGPGVTITGAFPLVKKTPDLYTVPANEKPLWSAAKSSTGAIGGGSDREPSNSILPTLVEFCNC